MKRFLVAYASSEGQTGKIAHHVARRLENRGHLTRLIDIKAHDSEAGADDGDAAILAGSLHLSRHDEALTDFVHRHIAALRAMPSAFLSVSLTAASQDAREIAALDEVVRSFLHDVGWQPDRVELVAGAVHDRQLNPLERFVLHRIVDAHGVTRHPSGDTELTDWDRLDAAVDAFAAQVVSTAIG
jgi:menaquinone-dependent protoporphyrinogen oxidase